MHRVYHRDLFEYFELYQVLDFCVALPSERFTSVSLYVFCTGLCSKELVDCFFLLIMILLFTGETRWNFFFFIALLYLTLGTTRLYLSLFCSRFNPVAIEVSSNFSNVKSTLLTTSCQFQMQLAVYVFITWIILIIIISSKFIVWFSFLFMLCGHCMQSGLEGTFGKETWKFRFVIHFLGFISTKVGCAPTSAWWLW